MLLYLLGRMSHQIVKGDMDHQIEFKVFLIFNLLDGDGNDIMKLNLTWNLVLDADEWYHRIF